MVVRPLLSLLTGAIVATVLPLSLAAQDSGLHPLPTALSRSSALASSTTQATETAAKTEPAIEAEAVSSPAPGSAAGSSNTAASATDEAPGDEYGIEYQVSLQEANSLLGRLSARLKQLVAQAWSFLGTPYRRGGTSRQGLDCSGLVGAVYGQQGFEMPRTAAEQFSQGQPVAESDLRPGDLVFFRDTYKHGISHVGIYVGDGRFIHAAGKREGVIVSDLSRTYYRLRFAGARRMAAPAAAGRLAQADLNGADGAYNASHAERADTSGREVVDGVGTSLAPGASTGLAGATQH